VSIVAPELLTLSVGSG